MPEAHVQVYRAASAAFSERRRAFRPFTARRDDSASETEVESELSLPARAEVVARETRIGRRRRHDVVERVDPFARDRIHGRRHGCDAVVMWAYSTSPLLLSNALIRFCTLNVISPR